MTKHLIKIVYVFIIFLEAHLPAKNLELINNVGFVVLIFSRITLKGIIIERITFSRIEVAL